MSDESQTTTDHETIENWAEERGGQPAVVERTENQGREGGVLRIDFQDEDELDDVSWDEFFAVFEENDLAFRYQEETDDGEQSRFFTFVGRGGDET